jgi:hypothetical protein
MLLHSRGQSAIATHLAAELAAYDAGLRELLQGGWSPELYRALSDRFDRMQMEVEALPLLASAWQDLLLTRLDLVQALWRLTLPARVNGKVVALHARHCLCIRELQRQCLQYGDAAASGARTTG